jgi:hypothetical protein
MCGNTIRRADLCGKFQQDDKRYSAQNVFAVAFRQPSLLGF